MRLAAVCLLLLLTACVGTDPYSQIAAGQAALQATQSARRLAQEKQLQQANAAAYEATRAAGEALAVEAQIRGTAEAVEYQQTAIALQSTQSAGDLQATSNKATADVVMLQSTAAYLVQYGAAMSTGTAIIQQREIQATAVYAAAARGRSWRFAGLVLGWGLATALLMMLAMLIHILWLRGRAQARVIEARAGLFANQTAAQLPASLPADDGRKEVSDFLYQSAIILGRNSNRLPRHDVMQGWSAERWTRVTDTLQRSGGIVKVAGRGSYIRGKYNDIGGLYQAVTSGMMTLTPPLSAGVSRNYPPNGEQNAERAEMEYVQ
jgi:hypothetical protein